ncbi:hypothetical protein D918_02861 [Trichuris suis]|nr:hypothetical protein D918_02861 [Trichuris suis]
MSVVASERSAIAYFRGEGNCHIVIGFERNGMRYVWRVRKRFGTDAREYLHETSNNSLFCHIMSRLFDQCFVVLPKLIRVDLPLLESLPHFQRYPVPAEWRTSQSRVYAAELPDLCYFTEFCSESTGDTVTVELKPKQGFIPLSLRRISPYCSNCLLQMVKSRNGTYTNMYDFCPLDLYSVDFKRVYRAVSSLAKIPHANMKVFKNGQLVHSNQNSADLDKLFGHRCTNGMTQGEDFAKLIAKILTCAYVENSEEYKSVMAKTPLLQHILLLQKQDTEGPFAVAEYIKELMKRSGESGDSGRLFAGAPTSVKAAAFCSIVAASLRDCSVMITMKIFSRKPETSRLPVFTLPCGCFVVYRMRLIDLDYKTPAKLVSYANRLKDALNLISQSDWKTKRPPCVE